MMNAETITLDVREDIRNGREPFDRIMKTVDALEEGQSLLLIAPFEPLPLYGVLAGHGLHHQSSTMSGGDWEIRFSHRGTGSKSSSEGGRPQVVEMDCRGFEPPEPMVMILDELMKLPPGGELRARTDRHPSFLHAELAVRGFNGATQKICDGSHVTTIREK